MISRFRDDAARIAATAINEILQKLGINHRVEGIAVLPAGATSYLVDIVMRDLTTQGTWAVSFTIPTSHQGKELHEETEHPEKVCRKTPFRDRRERAWPPSVWSSRDK